jgi:DNA-binding beta-propeller fold protein YncE
MRTIKLLLLMLFLINSTLVLAQSAEKEEYIFERLWPTLTQPWHFDRAYDLAVDKKGNVYVVNETTRQIKKFTGNGHLIRQWRFGNDTPLEIEVDDDGNIYVLYAQDRVIGKSSGLKFIRVLDPDVNLICEWGKLEGARYRWCSDSKLSPLPPEEDFPYYDISSRTMTIDDEGNVYLVNDSQNILQKFTYDGQPIGQWPIQQPIEDPDFIEIAVDHQNDIYVIYQTENRVLKYHVEGKRINLINQWNDFKAPKKIAFDSENNAYLTDRVNHRIVRKLSTETHFEEWAVGESGIEFPSKDDIQSLPMAIIEGSDFNIFSRIKNMLPDISRIRNIFEEIFESGADFSEGVNRFYLPWAIAIGGPNNKIYISVSASQDSLQSYNAEGTLIKEWKNRGTDEGEFYVPFDIVRDSQGNLFITDSFNHRVLKFSENGKFITAWGKTGVAQGEFVMPTGMAIDNADNIYVVDSGNLRIQKFDATGQFLQQWGGVDPKTLPSGADARLLFLFEQSEFVFPVDVVVDSKGNIYVIDMLKNHVKKMTATGELSKEFTQSQLGQGHFGEKPGELKIPLSITIDKNDNIYVADTFNHRIQKFTTEGNYVSHWGDQTHCLFNEPIGITTDNKGHVYVVDTIEEADVPIINSRIQKLKLMDGKQCQVITQWGEYGSFPGQFSDSAGLTVSPDGEKVYLADSKFNRIQVFKKGFFTGGKAIVVAGGGPGNSLWDVIETGAKFAYRTLTYQGFTKDSIYYLSADTESDDLDANGKFDDVDGVHTKENLKKAITEWAMDTGNLTLFLIDHGGDKIFELNDEEELKVEELNQWLDIWQENNPEGIITIIYEACKSGSFIPKLAEDKAHNRIIITSAKAEEDAALISQGALSFSNYFWSHIFYGTNIEDTFSEAKQRVINSSWLKQSPQLETNLNNLHQRYIGNGTEILGDAPVIDSSSIKLDDNNTLLIEAKVTDESDDNIARVWAVIIHANLQLEATGQPLTALPSCELEPTEEKGHFKSTKCTLDQEGHYEVSIYALDESNNISKPVVKEVTVGQGIKHKAIIIVASSDINIVKNTKQVYDTFLYQGYNKDDIYYTANISIGDIENRVADFSNIKWIENNTQELVIYLVGAGNENGLNLNETESLRFEQLKKWLDALQQHIPDIVITVVYEGENSGYLLPVLKGSPVDKKRIVISSNGINDKGYVENEFSTLFWQEIFKGLTVLDAFNNVQKLLEVPQLDDNGDGIYSTKKIRDGRLASKHTIGIGIGRAELPSSQKLPPIQPLFQNERLQILLAPLPENHVQYLGIQAPDSSFFILQDTITGDEHGLQGDLMPFENIGTMPVWKGIDDIAIDFEIDAIPKGRYQFYRYIHKEDITLNESSFVPKQLSKTVFYLRR